MNGNVFLLFLGIIAVFINLANCQYCNIKTCKNPRQHTLCLYGQNSVGSACTRNGNLGGGLTQTEKTDILNKHNALRQKVASGAERRGMPGPQPAATNMQNLVWDNELAAIAQTWADQCIWDHDKCRDVSRFSVGQNIAYKGTTGNANTIDTLSMVQDWYDEVQYFDNSQVKKYTTGTASNGEDTGHYTQIVWAKTSRLGCGLRKYNDGKFNRKYLVCNYGPGGNIKNTPVYLTS